MVVLSPSSWDRMSPVRRNTASKASSSGLVMVGTDTICPDLTPDNIISYVSGILTFRTVGYCHLERRTKEFRIFK